MNSGATITNDGPIGLREPTASPVRHHGFAAVRVLLGLLLLTTAGLKYADSSLEPLGHSAQVVFPRLHTAAIVAEAVLGLWLLYGRAARLLWLAAVAFFAGLASISLYLGLAGVPSCGCLGEALTVSPWYTLLLDLAAVAALVWWRPPLTGFSLKPAALWADEVRPALLPLRMPLAVWSLTLLGIAAWGQWRYGATRPAFARLQGYTLYAEHPAQRLGSASWPAKMTFQVRNLSPNPVTVIGAETSCRCYPADSYPFTLGPDETREVSFELLPANIESEQTFRRWARLLPSESGSPLTLNAYCRPVLPEAEPPIIRP